jgi:hypothetical protein
MLKRHPLSSFVILGFISVSAMTARSEAQERVSCAALYKALSGGDVGDSQLRKLPLDKLFQSCLQRMNHLSVALPVKPIKVDNAPPPTALTPSKPAAPQPGTAAYAQEYGQRFYVRQDNLDAFYYLYPSVTDPNPSTPTSPDSTDTSASSANKASGGSISWTDDRLKNTQVFNVQSYVGYVVARQLDINAPDNSAAPYISKWAIGPWLYADGIQNEPQKKTDRSAIQFGGEAQVEVSRIGPFAIVDFRAAPYYQTDFRGYGDIEGLDALVEPYNIDWFLGGADHAVLNDFAFIYWRMIGEVDARHVGDAGLSNMISNTDYAWLGGSLMVKATLFPNSTNSALANRINLSGTAQWFDDIDGRSILHDYVAEIAYNLNAAGSSSVSLQYSHGTDKATLVTADQLKLSLNFKM